MSRIWRLAAPVAVAGGLIAAGVAPAAQASPAAVNITISATSPHYPGAVHGKVFGFALVVYKASVGHLNTGFISGNITGAAKGDMATLWQEPFGSSTFSATTSSITLAGPTATPYNFAVQPSLATKYKVKVTAGAIPVKTSATQTVFVTEGSGKPSTGTKCRSGHCRTSLKLLIIVATGKAFRTESGKPWHFYFVLDPRFPNNIPKFLPLYKNASASKARKITPLEYAVTLTWRYATHLRNPQRFLIANACTKDTVSIDGYGLPGHHGCGNKKISTFATYLG